MVRCGFKNGHQKDTCLREIGLNVQKLLTILSSIVDINWDLQGMMSHDLRLG